MRQRIACYKDHGIFIDLKIAQTLSNLSIVTGKTD